MSVSTIFGVVMDKILLIAVRVAYTFIFTMYGAYS